MNGVDYIHDKSASHRLSERERERKREKERDAQDCPNPKF
jgi:hypothetical protein